MAYNETYEEFVEKFKPKLTTDDCYTPDKLWQGVKEYACERFNIREDQIIRPFYPGGDYQAEDYTGKIVVDNPPFSILSEIVRWYDEHGVKFFLFKNGLTLQKALIDFHILVTGRSMIAENGADVPCDFVTNITGKRCIEACPELGKVLQEAKPEKKAYTTRHFPPNVVRASDLGKLAKYGVSFTIENYERVASVGEPKMQIFGGAVLISDKDAREIVEKTEEALRNKDEIQRVKKEENGGSYTPLGEKEHAIINQLNQV